MKCVQEAARRSRFPPYPQCAWQQTFLGVTLTFCTCGQTHPPRLRPLPCPDLEQHSLTKSLTHRWICHTHLDSSVSRTWVNYPSFGLRWLILLCGLKCAISPVIHTLIRQSHWLEQTLTVWVVMTDAPVKVVVVYYESIKRELQTKLIYECRCDERLKTKVEESALLGCTVLHDKTN